MRGGRPCRRFAPLVGLLVAACGERSVTEKELEKELEKERARHTADVHHLSKELTEANARIEERMQHLDVEVPKIQALEEATLHHERLLGTVPVRHWVEVLEQREQDPKVREAAAHHLGGQRTRAKEVIAALLDATGAEKLPRGVAVDVVVYLEDAAVDPLLEELRAENETRRVDALAFLGALGASAEVALPRIAELITSQSSSPRVRDAAEAARGRIVRPP